MEDASKPPCYCPKCGSDQVLDYSITEAYSPNPMPMFCQDCHAIGTIEQFSKGPHFWNWRYWRIKLIPLAIAVTVSVFLPVNITVKTIIGTVLYLFLFSITWRHADGRKAFPPYLW